MNKIDFTPLYHAGLAFLCIVIIGLFLCPIFGLAIAATIGGTFGVAFYAGREVAQAEKREPNAHGGAWWRGFDVRLWDANSILDLLAPASACTAVVVACWIVGERPY